MVPANFPLGYAQELQRAKIRVQPTNGLFWPERETKTDEEFEKMRRALAYHRNRTEARDGSAERHRRSAVDKKLRWSGKTLTSEILRAEIDSAILRPGGVAGEHIVAGGDQACDPHERGFGPLFGEFADHYRCLSARREDRLLRRSHSDRCARTRQRCATQTVGYGEGWAGSGPERIKPGVDGMTIHQAMQIFHRSRISDRSSGRPAGGIFSWHRSRTWSGHSRLSAIAESRLESAARSSRLSRGSIIPVSAGFGSRTWWW